MYSDRDLMAVWTFQGLSGLPEDRFINTFAFRRPLIGTVGDFENIEAALVDFWQANNGAAGGSLGNHLGAEVPGDWTLRIYGLTDPEPRAPVYEASGDFGYSAGASLPHEVALCLSFQGANVSGLPQERRRGRVFIGPLANAANIVTTGGRPAASIITAGVEACSNLRSDVVLNGIAWCVNSRVDEALVEIIDGWVDNAFDTQRRRGLVPTARTTWE